MSRPRELPLLPFAPLLERATRQATIDGHVRRHSYTETAPPLDAVAQLLGISARHLHRIHKQAWISYDRADQMAIRLGHHPIEIWGDDWLAIDTTAGLFGRIRNELAEAS